MKTITSKNTSGRANIVTLASPILKPLARVVRGKAHPLVLSALLLGTGLGFGNHAQAACSWGNFGGCVTETGDALEQGFNDLVDTVTGEIIDPIIRFSDTTFSTAKTEVQEGINELEVELKKIEEAEKAIMDIYEVAAGGVEAALEGLEDFAMSAYYLMAEQFRDQAIGPLRDMADAWDALATNHESDFNAFVTAMASGDGQKIAVNLMNVLGLLFNTENFSSILTNFEQQHAGSLILMLSANASNGLAGVESGFGLAVDIEFLVYAFEQYTSQPATFATEAMAQYKNDLDEYAPVASLFYAGGLYAGPSAGAGAGLVIGYHTSHPAGVSGPGFDIGLELEAKAGGSLGIGFDVSKVPWDIVTAGIGIDAGLQVRLSGGPSYTVVLGQLCGNGKIIGLKTSTCPTSTTIYSGTPTTSDIDHPFDYAAQGYIFPRGVDLTNFNWAERETFVILGTNAELANPVPSLYPEISVGALKFTGTNNDTRMTPNVGSVSSYNFGKDDEFTVAFWIKPDQTQAHTQSPNSVVEKWHNTSQGYPYAIRYVSSSGKIQGARYDGSNNPRITSTVSINDGQWHHVAFVKDGALLKLYIDGVLNGYTTDTTTANTENTAPLYLGNRNNSKEFLGMIDELRIYDVAIGTEEINETLYNDIASAYYSGSSEPNYIYSDIWGGNGGGAFDDLTTLVSGLQRGDENRPYIKVLTLFSGSRVDRIELEYSDGTKVTHGGNGGGFQSVALLSPTTLQQVEVCKDYTGKYNSTTIHYIQITLSSGYKMTGGTRRGDCKTLKSSEGNPIVGFHGSSGNELDSLGVIFEQLPPEVIIDL